MEYNILKHFKKKTCFKRFFLVIFTFLSFSISILANKVINQNNSTAILNDSRFEEILRKAQKKTIKVAIVNNFPPYIFKDEKTGEETGIVIDIWKEIAKENNLKYKFIPMEGDGRWDRTVEETGLGYYDIALGSIIVNHKREILADFTRPFYIFQLGFALPFKKNSSILSIVAELFGNLIFLIMTVGLGLILLFSSVLWFFERKKSKIMKGKKGMINSIWITVTCFLRDLIYVPKSNYSRILIVIWLVISTVSMVLLTSMTTSFLTYSLTLADNDIKSKKDTSSIIIAVTSGSATYDSALEVGIPKNKLLQVKDLKAMQIAVEENKAQAIFGTYLSLWYAFKNDPKFSSSDMKMATWKPKLGEYAFVLPKGSADMEIYNRSIKKMQSKGIVRKICMKYIDEEKVTSCL